MALSWCLEDEAGSFPDRLLERFRLGDRVVVPAHWPTEVSNGLLMAVRRGRIPVAGPGLLWDQLAVLPIEVEPALSADGAKAVLVVAQQYGLTFYDAAYLELAIRRDVPLATLDSELIAAGRRAGVTLLQ